MVAAEYGAKAARKTPGGINGWTLLIASTGAVFAVAALKNNSVGNTFKAFLAGEWPTDNGGIGKGLTTGTGTGPIGSAATPGPYAPIPGSGSVRDEVNKQTAKIGDKTLAARVKVAMLMAPFLEGGGTSPLGTGGWGVGDGGNSYGPYQINLPYHPGMNSASATNPAAAVSYMLSSYISGVQSVPASLWLLDPIRAYETAIYNAERPAQMYRDAHGYAAVQGAYNNALAAA